MPCTFIVLDENGDIYDSCLSAKRKNYGDNPFVTGINRDDWKPFFALIAAWVNLPQDVVIGVIQEYVLCHSHAIDTLWFHISTREGANSLIKLFWVQEHRLCKIHGFSEIGQFDIYPVERCSSDTFDCIHDVVQRHVKNPRIYTDRYCFSCCQELDNAEYQRHIPDLEFRGHREELFIPPADSDQESDRPDNPRADDTNRRADEMRDDYFGEVKSLGSLFDVWIYQLDYGEHPDWEEMDYIGNLMHRYGENWIDYEEAMHQSDFECFQTQKQKARKRRTFNHLRQLKKNRSRGFKQKRLKETRNIPQGVGQDHAFRKCFSSRRKKERRGKRRNFVLLRELTFGATIL